MSDIQLSPILCKRFLICSSVIVKTIIFLKRLVYKRLISDRKRNNYYYCFNIKAILFVKRGSLQNSKKLYYFDNNFYSIAWNTKCKLFFFMCYVIINSASTQNQKSVNFLRRGDLNLKLLSRHWRNNKTVTNKTYVDPTVIDLFLKLDIHNSEKNQKNVLYKILSLYTFVKDSG